jgi:U3 small nucleolar RNA-associated protein 6
MAEQVQLHLESRLLELQDLVEKGIFTEERIRDVVTQRTKYEYRLKRRGAILEDFLAYIEYEKHLEVERRDKVTELSIKGHYSLSDYSIVEHVYALYQRALVKFKGDVNLWTQFLEYALVQGGRQVFSKGIFKAIQVHPRHAPFWIMSAHFEWNTNGNMTAARTLLQQAIRMDAEKVDIWLAFFEIELGFALKVTERRTLLGLEASEESCHQILNGAIAIAVFDCALESLPKMPPNALLRFMKLASTVPESLASVREHVLGILHERYLVEPDIMRAFIKEMLSNNFTEDSLQEIVRYMNSVLAARPSDRALQLCIDFLLSVSELVEHDSQAIVVAIVHDKARELFEFGEEAGFLNDELYCAWMKLATSLGYDADKSNSIRIAALEKFPNSINLLEMTVELDIAKVSSKKCLNSILKRISKLTSCPRYVQVCDCLIRHCCEYVLDGFPDNVSALCMIFLHSFIPISAIFVEALSAIMTLKGVQGVRQLCSAICEKRIVNSSFYTYWASIELACSPIDVSQVRRLYQKALVMDGSNEMLWRDLIAFERSQRCFSEAARLFDRALKAGANPQFLAAELS